MQYPQWVVRIYLKYVAAMM